MLAFVGLSMCMYIAPPNFRFEHVQYGSLALYLRCTYGRMHEFYGDCMMLAQAASHQAHQPVC